MLTAAAAPVDTAGRSSVVVRIDVVAQYWRSYGAVVVWYVE